MAKRNTKRKKIKIIFDAPITLIFCFACLGIFVFTKCVLKKEFLTLFSVPSAFFGNAPFNTSSILDYFRLIFHIFGHKNWNHLITNLCFILLLAPKIERKFGRTVFLMMIFVATLVSGVLNVCFGSSLVMGANSIVFMLILLTALTALQKQTIPFSVIALVCLFVSNEIFGGNTTNGFSEATNLFGGIVASLFGLIKPEKKQKATKPKQEEIIKTEEIDSIE